MKIRSIRIWGTSIYLNIEKRYESKFPMIPLGCDCHPAHVLETFKLRHQSLPFDWMNTFPLRGIEYVNENLKNNFSLYTEKLEKNKKKNVVSAHFEYSEFLHYPNLVQDCDMQEKFSHRANRFLQIIRQKKCYFLFNITSEALVSTEAVYSFIHSINEFHTITDQRHELLIYIRYNETFSENQSACDLLLAELNKIPNTRASRYVRHLSEFGIWGDPKQYTKLFKSLGVKFNKCLPRIYLSKTYSK